MKTLSILLAALLICSIPLLSQSWTSTNGPARGSVNVTDITSGCASTDAQPTVYDIEGTSIFKSTNAGTSWSSVSTPYAGAAPNLIVCQSATPRKVAVTSLNGSGHGSVNWDTAGGSNWQPSDISDDAHFNPKCIAGSPANNALLLLGTQKECSYHSLRRSLNGGQSWGTVTAFYSTYITDVTAVTWHTSSASYALAGGTTSASSCGGAATNGVFYSTDQGVNWSRSGNNLAKNIKAEALYTAGGTSYAFAATDESGYKLYKNTDPYNSSSSWSQVTSYPGGLITDLRADGTNNLYATSANGVYKSTDNGSNWSSCEAGFIDAANFTRIAVNPRGADTVLAASANNLYRSTDGGATWRDVARSTSALSTSTVAASGSLVIGGLTGSSLIDRTTGSGWYPVAISSCVTDFRSKMAVFQSTAGTTVFQAGYRISGGNKGSFLRSTNGGDAGSWSETKAGAYTGGTYNGVAVDPANSSRVYVWGLGQYGHSGSNENVAISADAGSSWNAATPIPNNSQSNIPEVIDLAIDSSGHGAGNSNILYAALRDSVLSVWGIYKSTNGGSSWSSSVGNMMNAVTLNPKAAATVYAAGRVPGQSNCSMWKTTNSGSSWSQLNTVTQLVTRITMHPSYPTSANYLWMVDAGNNKIYKTANGGTSWIEITTGLGTIYDLRTDQSSNRYFYAATSTGVYKIDPKPEAPTGLAATAEGDGCGGGGDFMMFGDGGAGTNSGGGGGFTCHPRLVWNANTEADLSSYNIFRSTNGTSYSYIGNTSATTYLDGGANLLSGGTFYYKITAVDNGTNQSDYSNVVSVSDVGGGSKANVAGGIPAKFELFQNTPNPFNPTTTIKYALAKPGYVTLKLYDVVGREAATLVNEYEDAGYKTVEFNASNLASGVYFYRLETAEFTDVKRMLLMK